MDALVVKLEAVGEEGDRVVGRAAASHIQQVAVAGCRALVVEGEGAAAGAEEMVAFAAGGIRDRQLVIVVKREGVVSRAAGKVLDGQAGDGHRAVGRGGHAEEVLFEGRVAGYHAQIGADGAEVKGV